MEEEWEGKSISVMAYTEKTLVYAGWVKEKVTGKKEEVKGETLGVWKSGQERGKRWKGETKGWRGDGVGDWCK